MSDDVSMEELAQQAQTDDAALKELVGQLAGPSRRTRQQAAAAVREAGAQSPERIVPFAAELIDALNRPEAQTRWECLDMLTALVPLESRACDKALHGAEASLFDEESGPVRLAAMRFLCKLGATTENRSEKTWPLIDEAIQCYHGDLEFQDMLVAVLEFSEGKLASDVRSALAARMQFDAENSHGTLQKRAQQIIANVG